MLLILAILICVCMMETCKWQKVMTHVALDLLSLIMSQDQCVEFLVYDKDVIALVHAVEQVR